VYYALDRMSLRRYERVLCVSQDLVEDCRRAGVKADRCVLLENGIDTEDFRRSRGIAEAKRLLGVPTDRVLIGAAGRLSREKGFETLILAADALIRAGQNVELRIAGEGDQAAKLDRVIRSLGRSSRIRLLGYQADLRTFYEALDLFALSSVREGLPNVLLEALAYEIPVVATAVNGIPSLVDRHRCGLLVEPGSAKALAAGLAALIAEPGRRHELGRRGRLAAETQYSFATRMDVVSGIYDDLLNGERS
jgi:glycosyltransferase involved in cell wall biosynthesis